VLDLTDEHGADVVCDLVGGDLVAPSWRCTAREGRYLAVGFTDDDQNGMTLQQRANRFHTPGAVIFTTSDALAFTIEDEEQEGMVILPRVMNLLMDEVDSAAGYANVMEYVRARATRALSPGEVAWRFLATSRKNDLDPAVHHPFDRFS
jgi:threonine dehydrogenase-like Zn-dependent dehydrogenase